MTDRKTDQPLVNNAPPKATFTRAHYEAIQYVLRNLPELIADGQQKSIVMHFNHYMRATQDAFNSEKFIEGCRRTHKRE